VKEAEIFRIENQARPEPVKLDESFSTKRTGISNLKPKKVKPDFGLYHPNTGIPVFFAKDF
jgi:hypothetical protein